MTTLLSSLFFFFGIKFHVHVGYYVFYLNMLWSIFAMTRYYLFGE